MKLTKFDFLARTPGYDPATFREHKSAFEHHYIVYRSPTDRRHLVYDNIRGTWSQINDLTSKPVLEYIDSSH